MTRAFLIASSVFAVLASQVHAEANPAPTMAISATGTVHAEPDQATIHFGVYSTGREARDAMALNKSSMQAAFQSLAAAGIGPKDITTTGIALSPRYDRYDQDRDDAPPRIRGYEAHNAVSVTVTDLSRLGDVLDKLVESGVNGIDEVSFGLQDPTQLQSQARTQAAQSARMKAETYAGAIGTQITGIISFSEQDGAIPRPYAQMEMARGFASSAVPVSAGEMEVSVTVHVVFGLDGSLE